ncbi:hypothetical protein NDU88_009908 [Pleurodeles waltl]|uniref:Uncharacterized protein n=1 Tax=Pleurodeles waltl TaxID=8319 RepID=A0AAV7QVV6_PLEWA|nr:hypothetical protein NDU88_009908 [Pleurodeles waltl]
MDPPRLGELCRSVFPPDGCQQALLHANRAFGVFGRCWGPGGTRRSQIGPAERGDVEQDKEPSLNQVAPGEVPETGTTRMRETVLAEVAQRSPTSPETNLESRAMQVRVPWTQAWLCTKDFRRKCTGAGVACKVAVPSNAAFWCLRLQGEDSVDPREISSELLVQRGGRLPPQHAQAGKQSRRRQDQRYRVAVVVFATMLQVCRLPARSAVDSLSEGEEGDAEELG